MRLWGPEHFDPNVIDSKGLEAAVNALSKKWRPRRRVTRQKWTSSTKGCRATLSGGAHHEQHLAGCAGLMQAHA